MTTRDPYIAEAARRLAAGLRLRPLQHTAQMYVNGGLDNGHEVKTLADTLKELGWKPPPKTLEEQAAEAAVSFGWPDTHSSHLGKTYGACLDAIERYKKLAPPVPAARDPQPLLAALDKVVADLGPLTGEASRGTFDAYSLAADTLREWGPR